MAYKNFPMVPFVVYGRGSFDQLGDIIRPHRVDGKPFIFFVDNCFRLDKAFLSRVPVEKGDELILVDVNPHEPSTYQVDNLRDYLKNKYGDVSGIAGMGGGAVMDITKAVSLMMRNEGSSADYQGWDLVKHKGVYHVGIPTLSGTGAEVSRTAVLIGPEKKLGLNSDFTPFDQAVLDPELIKNVPVLQRFYTGMDNYLHCIESLNGSYMNTFSQAYGEKAFQMCHHVFYEKDVWDDDSDNHLMMASWFGGMSIAYSQVGIIHAMGYGLGFALGIRHGEGNCIVFNQLSDFYPSEVKEFKKLKDKLGISLPKGICSHCTEEQFAAMVRVAYGMTPLWENALGKDWQKIMTPERLRSLYERM